MSRPWIATGSLIVFLGGCGGFNISDAAERIALARGCEPAELTLVEGHRAGYAAQGCGERGIWTCAAGQCSETSNAEVSPGASARVEEARQGIRDLEGPILDCVGGSTPLTIQVRYDAAGQPSGLRASPVLDGERRSCVGHLVLDLRIASAGTELLVSHTFGAAARTEVEPEPAVVDTPVEEATVEEAPAEEAPAEEAPAEEAPAEETPTEGEATEDEGATAPSPRAGASASIG